MCHPKKTKITAASEVIGQEVDTVVHSRGRRALIRSGCRYASSVGDPSDVETRLTALEVRMEEVAADAAAARHLAAARDRDLADLGVKVDANRSAINALGLQTAGRFDHLENRVDRLEDEMRTGFDEMRTGFSEMRGKLDQTAGGQQQIVDLLTGLIAGQGDQ